MSSPNFWQCIVSGWHNLHGLEDYFVNCVMSKEKDKGKIQQNIAHPKPEVKTKLMVNVSTSKNSKGMFSETNRDALKNKSK